MSLTEILGKPPLERTSTDSIRDNLNEGTIWNNDPDLSAGIPDEPTSGDPIDVKKPGIFDKKQLDDLKQPDDGKDPGILGKFPGGHHKPPHILWRLFGRM